MINVQFFPPQKVCSLFMRFISCITSCINTRENWARRSWYLFLNYRVLKFNSKKFMTKQKVYDTNNWKSASASGHGRVSTFYLMTKPIEFGLTTVERINKVL